MSRQGRTSWTTRVSPGRLQEMSLAVALGATAREVFLRFNLERHVRFQTFRTWVCRKRRELTVRDTADAASKSQPDRPLARGRWGNRGIRRIRRAGLELVSGQDRETVAGVTLLDFAEELRLFADRLVDVARAFFGATTESQDDNDRGAGVPGG